MEVEKKSNSENGGYNSLNSISSGDVEASQSTKQSEAQRLLDKIYKTNVPEPVFDQAKADRLQRMGRINQLGQGVSVLGDMLGASLGAKVKRRQPDGVAAGLYNSFENNMDKYKSEQDTYDLRNMSKHLEDARTGLGEARRTEQLDFANRKQEDYVKAKTADRTIDWNKWSADYDLKDKNSIESARHNKAMESSALIRANKTGVAKVPVVKEFDPIEVFENGKKIKLSQGDWDKLYQDGMRDKEFLNGNLKAEISKYKDIPGGGIQQIARAYHDYQQQKQYKVNEQVYLDQQRQEQGLSTGPAGTVTPTPTTSNNYSTGGLY